MPIVYRKIYTDESEEELSKMSRAEVTHELNDKQIRFAEKYTTDFNITHAALKAGYSKKSAHIIGWKLRQVPAINRYIAWLKLRVAKQCHVDAMDIIDQYVKIGFADITNFVHIKNGTVKLKDGAKMDGQLVTEVKQGRDGIGLKLADKLSALDKLERYFDVMPADWKQKIEEEKLELMKQKLELEKVKAGVIDDEGEDDGFIEALKETAEEVWEDG